MKQQNASNKLAFNKAAVAELNDDLLNKVNGGTSIVGGETCTGCCCVTVIRVTQVDVVQF